MPGKSEMIIQGLDVTKKVMVIAEIGNNHEGNYGLAEEMIRLAAEAGADAVKFQTIRPEHFIAPHLKARLEMLKKFELSWEQFGKLKQAAERAGVLFLSTPFDLESARYLNALVPAFKIASGDNTFYPLIEEIAAFGKPILLSSGMASVSPLRYAKALIERAWAKAGINPGLAVLHCVSSYPVPAHEAHLSMVRVIEKELGCIPGYSDHTLGIEAAVLSVAAGARVVEKHFTSNKNFSDFRDHKLSADPSDMKHMVQRIREVEVLLGSGEKRVMDCEKENLQPMRRSICAARELKRGEVLSSSDITWLRPGGGLEPGQEMQVLGRRLKGNVAFGEGLMPEMLEET